MPNFTLVSSKPRSMYPIQDYNRLQYLNKDNLSPKYELYRTKNKNITPQAESIQSEIARFIEITKYFSSPLRKTATYLSEERLVSYPTQYRIDYKRGGITPQRIKFNNLALVPVYVKLFKIIPDLEQIKYTNLSLSRSKRIPPGLSFELNFVYDDVNEKVSSNAQMLLIATKKTSTPCYQVCEIDLQVCPLNYRLIQV